ncbi:MAG: sigma-54-dependent Fis family transcriptional regulator [Phycisphaerae bacterium]|nr:sigma-54-dependent Fis family transcriptional regulator [Phycisphaerae bacterium]
MANILIVDDKEMMRDSLQAILVHGDHEVVACESAIEALNQVRKFPFDLIISDLKMPQMDGLAFIDELRNSGIEIPLIMMTAYADVSTAVQAMRKGAFDYIQKPFDADAISVLVDKALEHSRMLNENEALRVDATDWQRGKEFIGQSMVMQQVMNKVSQVARTNCTVLIRGDSGTGKEMIARAIHSQSPRTTKPLLCVNCAALSSTLLESELFGHEKGAFTGADRARKGRFELADGGTLLLDEISEMDLQLQAKLLRVLQEREFERVGSSVTRQVNVRLLATTNRDLEKWVAEGKFREDLFYRLNVVPILLPNLAQRVSEDLELLCDYFLERFAQREGATKRHLSNETLAMLKKYHWPGNVRELENLMERVSILCTSEIITPDLIEGWLTFNDQPAANIDATIIDMSEPKPLALVEREVIESTLRQFDGHRQKTAEALGIGLRTLGMKLKKWQQEKAAV